MERKEKGLFLILITGLAFLLCHCLIYFIRETVGGETVYIYTRSRRMYRFFSKILLLLIYVFGFWCTGI
ncbi:hypothetical protein V1520DRAFT_343851 [Lipomyces starkeyi]